MIVAQTGPVNLASVLVRLRGSDCATEITVRVRGENLSAKSRFGNQWLSKTDNTGVGPVQVELGNGSKKTVAWTTFWPSATINPATGAKFNGYATGVVTGAWTGWLYNTGPVLISAAC
jgi:hypothetical protein